MFDNDDNEKKYAFLRRTFYSVHCLCVYVCIYSRQKGVKITDISWCDQHFSNWMNQNWNGKASYLFLSLSLHSTAISFGPPQHIFSFSIVLFIKIPRSTAVIRYGYYTWHFACVCVCVSVCTTTYKKTTSFYFSSLCLSWYLFSSVLLFLKFCNV